MYVFDGDFALVTSANATNAGLHRNLECGLATDDAGVVNSLANSLMEGLNGALTEMSAQELEEMRAPVAAIRATMPDAPAMVSSDHESLADQPYVQADIESMRREFTGWKRLTLEGVLSMPEGGFRLRDLLEVCEPWAAEQYPDNRNVDAKLRQQLQMLRGMEVVEFVAPGRYRRTAAQ